MRVLLTGGGTSGHVNPALAIADIIKEREPDSEIAYVGTPSGIECGLVAKEGYEYFPIKIQGIARSLSPKNIKAAYLALTAPQKAKKIIKDFCPDVVIGTGGYVCWAPLKAAAELGVPTVVHESNSIPGLAVRKLDGKVDLILTNFEESVKNLKYKERVSYVGNPVRFSRTDMTREAARAALGIPESVKFVILSFGGSLGAEGVNIAAVDVMRGFVAEHTDVAHFHAGGKRYYADAVKRFESFGLKKSSRLSVNEYIYDMKTYMAAADLVICRAGAMTLTELAIMGKPAILIPSPNVTDDHQYKNAKVLGDCGAAIVIRESELDAERITSAVKSVYESAEQRRRMSEQISKFANPDVADQIYKKVRKLIDNKDKK